MKIGSLLVIAALLLAGCGKEGGETVRSLAESSPTPAVTSEPSPSSTPAPTPELEATPIVDGVPVTASPVAEVEWVRQDEGTFTFERPADMVDQRAQGIDSQVGHFKSATADLAYDYGWYSGDAAEPEAEDYTEQWTRVDGRFAHITRWRASEGPAFQSAIYFDDVREPRSPSPEPGQTTGLVLTVSASDSWDDGDRIVRSIRFTP